LENSASVLAYSVVFILSGGSVFNCELSIAILVNKQGFRVSDACQCQLSLVNVGNQSSGAIFVLVDRGLIHETPLQFGTNYRTLQKFITSSEGVRSLFFLIGKFRNLMIELFGAKF